MKTGTGIVILALSIMIISNGCVSSTILKNTKREIALRRAIAANDEKAIQAIQLGDTGAGIGYDVGNMEAIGEHPWKQAGAALADAVILYGCYAGVRYVNDEIDSDSDDKSSNDPNTTSGNDANVVTVNGDANNVELNVNSNNSEENN